MASDNIVMGVNLKFGADVTAAKRAMAELQSSLAQVNAIASSGGKIGGNYSKELNQASQAAAQLRIQLQNAFNVDTGKLNLTKFSQDMQKSGMSLEKYKASLLALGPAGQKAFSQLAYNIATADTKVLGLSSSFQRLGATFMNTFRYQLSSRVLMGFISSISSAIGYVKDLNASLNDIRIVTDYGIDRMKQFAIEANKAAKALSSTTNEYAKASLIYFQQGLNDTQVKQRTDLTIKMANVTGQAVKEVSDQLTAVWNNFDNGTKSLEHYVDVMVALGAATASSTDEIAEGLNKFAAVAETVGLSYEYAASALATVTSTTRQSAEVVGTAFKTLFARIQDLELGNTLDDGTTMGQYSEALAAVGISIKDTNGQVKSMNAILDEMGAKWNSLNKDTQIALAQNVAGVRQYTQLIALMDNWSKFQDNLNTSLTSAGALQNQADIYAESWEAAKNRVKASLETIYDSLLDDEFFIDMTDNLADFIGFIDDLVKGLGGLKGVLRTVGVILTGVFSTQIANGINTMATSIRSLTPAGRQANQKMQEDALENAKGVYGSTGVGGQQTALSEKSASVQLDFVRNKDKMLDQDRQSFEIRLKELDNQKRSLELQLEENKALEQNLTLQKKKVINNEKGVKKQAVDRAMQRLQGSSSALAINEQIGVQTDFSALTLKSNTANIDKYKKDIEELQSRLKSLGITSSEISPQLQGMITPELSSKYQNLAKSVETAQQELKSLDLNTTEGRTRAEQLADAIVKANISIEKQATAMQTATEKALIKAGVDRKLIDEIMEVGWAAGQAQGDIMRFGQQAEDTAERIRNTRTKVSDLGSVIVKCAQGISGLSMAFSSLRGIFDVLNNNEMTFWEKLLSITTTLAMTIPMVAMGLKALKEVELKSTVVKIANAAATWGQAEAEETLARKRNKNRIATNKETGSEIANTGSKKIKQWFGDKKTGLKNKWGNFKNNWNEQAFSNASPEMQAYYKNQNRMGYSARTQYSYVNGKKTGSLVFQNRETGEIISREQYKNLKNVDPKTLAGKDALKGFGKKALSKAGTAAVIVAAVAAAKAIYKAADEAYNRDENAAKRAEASAKRLADAYGKANEKFNELKTSMETYQDNIKSIDELTKGTVEYTEAIYNANEEALNLISTYKIMADQYTTTAEGLIVFNEGVLENIKLQELQQKNAAMMASTIANQEARDLRTTADTTEFLREKAKGSNREITTEDKAIAGKSTAIGLGVGAVGAGAAMLAGAGAGTKLAGSLGSAFGPIGTAIGAVIGAVVGAAVGGIVAWADKKEATSNEKKAIETLSDAYNKMGNAALTPENMKKLLGNVGIDDENLIESLNQNSKELEKLLIEMKANTEARRAENINMARQQFSTMDAAFTSFDGNIQNTMAKLAGDRMLKRQEEIEYDKKDYRKGRIGPWWAKKATTQGKEQFDEWIKDQGIDLKNYNFKGDKINYKYYDEEGKVQKASLSYDDLAAWQEGQQIAKETEESYQKLFDDVWEMSQKAGGEGLLTVLGGQDVNMLTQDQIDSLTSAYKDDKFDEFFEKYGKETGENYAQAIENAINNWDYNTALTNYARKTQQEIDTILAQGAEATGSSKYALESYAETLMENSEALQNFSNKFKELDSKKIATEMAVANAKFAKGVVSLNKALKDNLDILQEWNEESLDTWEAVAQVQTALEEAFGVKVSADYIKNNLKDIQALADGDTSSLENLQQAATKDFILNLAISDDAKGNFVAMINQFIEEAKIASNDLSIDVGATMDLDSYTEQLNKMLEAGDITAEEVKKTFAAIGYAVDIRTTQKEVKNISKFSMKSPDGEEWSGEIVNTSVMEVPYIAGENTAQQGYDVETNTGEHTTVGNKTSGNGFTYTGGNKTKGNLLKGIAKESEKAKKELIDEIDIYKEINEQLSDMERILNRIAKAKDNAFGERKLDYLDYEIERQKELIELEKQKLGIAQKDMKTKRGELDTGFDVDEKGNITNYYDYLKSIAGKIDDSKYNEIKNSADKYIEARSIYLDQWEKIIDDENELFSKELETVTLKIDLDISLAEDALSLLDFQIEALGDSWDRASERFGHYIDKIGQEENKISSYMKGIKGILGKSVDGLTDEQILDPETFMSLLGDTELTSEQIELLRQYRDGILESTTNMLELRDTIRDDMISCFEDWNEEIDKQAETFDRVSKSIQGYRDIIDLVGKDVLGVSDELLNKMNETNIQNTQNALKASKSALDNDVASLEYAKQQYEAAVAADDEEGKKFWKAIIDPLKETVAKRKDEYLTDLKDSLQAAADALKDSVDQIMDSFETAMSGIAGSFDELSQKYDQQSEINERYLEDYEKIYNLSKMNRDIQNSLNDVDNIKSKQKLLELQEEIYKLQESGAKVTQYEVDEMQARYELRLAEIALEEAQNAKSNVQMKRDSEGNWSYVYTADQENVAEAQQNVEDKLYNLQKVVSDRRKTMEDELMSLPEEFADSVRQIAEDITLDEEERNRRLEENAQYYTDKHKWITEQLGISLEDAKRLYNTDWQTYSDAIGYKISKNGEWITSFDGTVASELLGYNDLTTAHNNFETSTNIMMANLTTAYETYKVNVASTMEAAEASISGFATTVGEDIDELKIKSDKAAESIEDIGEDGKIAFKTLVDKATEWWPKYNEKLNDYIGKNTAWATAVNEIIQNYAKLNGMKFPGLESELNKILAMLAQANGTNYTYEEETKPPAEGALTLTSYSSAGLAEAVSRGDVFNVTELDRKTGFSPEQEFTAKDFEGMTLNELQVKGLEKNGVQHFFSQDDLQKINEAGWLTKEKKEEKGAYYGIYTDYLGNKVRTNQLYTTKSEAIDGAIKERAEYAEKIIKEHQYKASQGYTGDHIKYADSTKVEVLEDLNKGELSTVKFEDNTADSINLSKLGSEEVYKLDLGNGNFQYLSKGNYHIFDAGGYTDLVIFNKDTNRKVKNILITPKQVTDIRKKFGDSGIDSTISGSGDPKSKDPDFEPNDVVTFNGSGLFQIIQQTGDNEWDTSNYRRSKWEEMVPAPYTVMQLDPDGEHIKLRGTNKSGNSQIFWMNKTAVKSFDTGGYTGSWGPEGRLAMLHQKEIILNADDTANFLSAINIVRDIASMIDLRAAAQQSALSMMAAASSAPPMTQTLQQEVTIHAEFPNASERSEIEAAFDSLLNRASQFANRKN